LLVSISVSIITSCCPIVRVQARQLRDEHARERQIERRAVELKL
jgi:hypothetical protein